MSNDWLQDLKAGDEVIVSGRGDSIEKIESVTKTQIVIGSMRFNRKDGYLRGMNAWNITNLRPVTDDARRELEAIQRRRRLLSVVESARWRDVPVGKLERIAAILDETEEPQP